MLPNYHVKEEEIQKTEETFVELKKNAKQHQFRQSYCPELR